MTDSTPEDIDTWKKTRKLHYTATRNSELAGYSKYKTPELANTQIRKHPNHTLTQTARMACGTYSEEPILEEFAETYDMHLAPSPLVISALDPREAGTADTSIDEGALDRPVFEDGGWNLWSPACFASDGMSTGEAKNPAWDMNKPPFHYAFQSAKQFYLWRRAGGYLMSSEVPAGRRNTWFIGFDPGFHSAVMRRSRQSARYIDANLPHPKHVSPWEYTHMERLIAAKFRYRVYKNVECRKRPSIKPLHPCALPPPIPISHKGYYRREPVEPRLPK